MPVSEIQHTSGYSTFNNYTSSNVGGCWNEPRGVGGVAGEFAEGDWDFSEFKLRKTFSSYCSQFKGC
jgi:hypothetical protein